MDEYNTTLSHAVECLEEEIRGYERYKWLLTTEEVKADPELYNMMDQAMQSERQHASALVGWINAKLQ